MPQTTSAQTGSPPAVTPVTTLHVWPEGKMPGHGAGKPEANDPSGGSGVQLITDVSQPDLAVFPAPGKGAAPAPAVIVCPGGAYTFLSYSLEGTQIVEWLNSAGIAAVILKYRVPDNREGALQDFQRTIRLVRAHAANWGIDPGRLGVLGFSAGGHLAAKGSYSFDRRTYPAVDTVDDRSCRPDFAVLVYPAYLDQDGKLAADLKVAANLPPTLIIHTEDDTKYVAAGKVYHAVLDEVKAPNEFILYRSGGHGYGLHSKGDSRAWPKATLEWLRKIGVR